MIRYATELDVERILYMASMFSEKYKTPPPHMERAKKLAQLSIMCGTCLIDEENHIPVGCIVGIRAPHPFMDMHILASMFTCSFGQNGFALMREFVDLGKRLGVDAITTSVQFSYDKDPSRVLRHFGFEPTEVGWQLNLQEQTCLKPSP